MLFTRCINLQSYGNRSPLLASRDRGARESTKQRNLPEVHAFFPRNFSCAEVRRLSPQTRSRRVRTSMRDLLLPSSLCSGEFTSPRAALLSRDFSCEEFERRKALGTPDNRARPQLALVASVFSVAIPSPSPGFFISVDSKGRSSCLDATLIQVLILKVDTNEGCTGGRGRKGGEGNALGPPSPVFAYEWQGKELRETERVRVAGKGLAEPNFCVSAQGEDRGPRFVICDS
jgi:hypothetical protein